MSNDFFQNNDEFLTEQTPYVIQSTVINDKKKAKGGDVPFSVIVGVIIIIAIIGVVTLFFLSKLTKTNTQVEKLTEDIITVFEQSDLSEIKSYILPATLESYRNLNAEDRMIAYTFLAPFLTPEYDFLDYSIISEMEQDEQTLPDSMKKYSSYVEPLDYARVEVEVSYGSQKSSVYFKYAYCDGRYYLYEIDDSEYDIDFSDYKFSNIVNPDDITEMLENNSMTVEGEISGERVFFDGYSVIVPDNWTVSSTEEPSLVSNGGATSISIFIFESIADEQETLVKDFANLGFVTTDAGSFATDTLTGYYMELYEKPNELHIPQNSMLVSYPMDDMEYVLHISKNCKEDSTWGEAMKIAASFRIE